MVEWITNLYNPRNLWCGERRSCEAYQPGKLISTSKHEHKYTLVDCIKNAYSGNIIEYVITPAGKKNIADYHYQAQRLKSDIQTAEPMATHCIVTELQDKPMAQACNGRGLRTSTSKKPALVREGRPTAGAHHSLAWALDKKFKGTPEEPEAREAMFDTAKKGGV